MFALEYELAKTIQLQSKQCCSLLCKKQKSKNQVIKHLSIETGNKNTLKRSLLLKSKWLLILSVICCTAVVCCTAFVSSFSKPLDRNQADIWVPIRKGNVVAVDNLFKGFGTTGMYTSESPIEADTGLYYDIFVTQPILCGMIDSDGDNDTNTNSIISTNEIKNSITLLVNISCVSHDDDVAKHHIDVKFKLGLGDFNQCNTINKLDQKLLTDDKTKTIETQVCIMLFDNIIIDQCSKDGTPSKKKKTASTSILKISPLSNKQKKLLMQNPGSSKQMNKMKGLRASFKLQKTIKFIKNNNPNKSATKKKPSKVKKIRLPPPPIEVLTTRASSKITYSKVVTIKGDLGTYYYRDTDPKFLNQIQLTEMIRICGCSGYQTKFIDGQGKQKKEIDLYFVFDDSEVKEGTVRTLTKQEIKKAKQRKARLTFRLTGGSHVAPGRATRPKTEHVFQNHITEKLVKKGWTNTTANRARLQSSSSKVKLDWCMPLPYACMNPASSGCNQELYSMTKSKIYKQCCQLQHDLVVEVCGHDYVNYIMNVIPAEHRLFPKMIWTQLGVTG